MPIDSPQGDLSRAITHEPDTSYPDAKTLQSHSKLG
jgi:hypothetical protein